MDAAVGTAGRVGRVRKTAGSMMAAEGSVGRVCKTAGSIMAAAAGAGKTVTGRVCQTAGQMNARALLRTSARSRSSTSTSSSMSMCSSTSMSHQEQLPCFVVLAIELLGARYRCAIMLIRVLKRLTAVSLVGP